VTVVVDASVIAALLFGEPDGDVVAARLGGSRLAAPSLLRYELASICAKKIRRYPRQREGLQDALQLLPRLAIDEVQVPTEEMARLAGDVGISAYDAAYLWLAQYLGTPLITLDRRLLTAANDLGIPEPT
jgi:predicted nucleic acid-binding protein